MLALLLAACTSPTPASAPEADPPDDPPASREVVADDLPDPPFERGPVTLAFGGDVHFELHLRALLERPRQALGPIERVLRGADVAMVNLESAITTRGRPEAKELEVPSQRYHFRTSPAALEVLDKAGVDVVTMANNHGADYGRVGLRDSLAAKRNSPVPVVGIGRDRAAALAPHLVSVRGTDFAFLAADSSTREGASNVWAAGPANPGVAAARAPRPQALLAAVRAASRAVDVVVVYLHWGAEGAECPTPRQRTTARALAAVGADVVVGTHAHVLQGSGWLGDTYVNYGLGNLVWYHNSRPRSGVLQVRVEGGEVVGDRLTPAVIGADGLPRPLTGPSADAAVADWRAQRGCTGLAAGPSRP